MKQQCSDFCGPAGISMLMGSTLFGVSGPEAEEIVLPPSGVLMHDDELMTRCRRGSTALREIDVKTSSFIRALEEFNAAVLYYRAELFNSTAKTREYMQSEAFANRVATAVYKMNEVRE